MNYPLPPIPDPLSPLVNLNFQTARELCSFLDLNDNCKIVLDYLRALLKKHGVTVVTHSGLNGETFLNFLQNRFNNTTVHDLECMLERCSLEEPLYLFREQAPVKIVTQPTSQKPFINGQSNGRIYFEINSNDAFPMPRFQWFFRHENANTFIKLDGKISQTLIFHNFCASDVGRYFCQIQQKCRDGTDRVIRSRSVSLSMKQFAPNISLQPKDFKIHVYDQIELKCYAEAYPSPTYQWRKNNVDLPGEVHSTLLILNASVDHSGCYSCFISNVLGSVVTREARILVTNIISQMQPTASIKMALLIGNWAYSETHRLEKVQADVKTFRDILYRMNFEVMALCNLTKTEISTAVKQFCHLLLKGAYVVVYFAGHGIHKFGDYIIPVGAPSDLQKCTLDDLISVNEIISCIQTSKKTKLLAFLLDSCRTIPQWNATPTSYMHLHTDNNLIIGYATSENRGAYEVTRSENGIFMTFFKEEIIKPKIFIDDALKNVQIRFKQEFQGDEVLSDQIPQVTRCLGEDLSLHDPIDGRRIGAIPRDKFYDKYYRWKSLPSSMNMLIPWNDTNIDITVKFMPMDKCFLNMLIVEVTFHNLDDWPFKPIPVVHPQECLKIVQIVQQFPRFSLTIDKLQMLKENAVVCFHGTKIDRNIFSIPLGRPLISSLSQGRDQNFFKKEPTLLLTY